MGAMSTRASTIAFVILLAGPLVGESEAADLWLEPLRFRADQSEGRIGVRARIGSAQRSRALIFERERTRGLWTQGPQGWEESSGRAGDDPLGMARLQGRGAHLVAYRGQPGFGRLGSEGWVRLFMESGLEPSEAPSGVTGIRYQRSAKTLLLAGAPKGQPWSEPLGLELELIPLRAPHELSEGAQGLSPLPLRLVWGGKALAGVELRAWPLKGPALSKPVVAVTDSAGRAELRLTRRGPWVACATALRPGDLTRWEAAFTSFSFSADPAPPAEGPRALAEALREARRRGVLKRILGIHHFTFNRRHFEGGKEVGVDQTLMTYRVSYDPPEGDAAATLRVAVDVSPKGTPHGVVFEYAVDLREGRLRWLQNQEGRFVPQGDRLETARGPARVDPALLLPKVVGVFLVPMLAEAMPEALPASLRLIDLTPFATLSRPLLLRPARLGEEDYSKDHRTWVTEEGRARPTTRVRAARSGPFRGKLVEIRTRSLIGIDGPVVSLNDCQRITEASYRERWRAWFGERK